MPTAQHRRPERALIAPAWVQELQELCTPGSSNFKLTHLFLYVVGPEQKVRPPDVPQAQWEAALQRAGGAGNRSGLWPVPVRGLQQLKAHHDAQQGALQANRSCLAELQGLVQRLAQWDEAALRRRTQAIMDQHSNLSLRLLKVCLPCSAVASLCGDDGIASQAVALRSRIEAAPVVARDHWSRRVCLPSA